MEKFHNDAIEKKLITIILTVFNLKHEAVFSRCRKRELVICRQTIHSILKDQLQYSYSESGEVTGHEHCTAIHSKKSIQNILDSDFQPFANYIYKVKHLCSIVDYNPIRIKVKAYVFFEHSNLVL